MSDDNTKTTSQAQNELETELTSATFDEFIKDGYTFVDFWAEWCTPCKMVAPTIHKIAGEWQGKIKVGKLDTDANTDIAMKYQVLGIPTFILFKDGQIVARMTGAMPAPMFTQFLNDHYQDDVMPAAA